MNQFKKDVEKIKGFWAELEEAGQLHAVWFDGSLYGIVDINIDGHFCLGWVSEISYDSLENMLGCAAELFESYEDALSVRGGSLVDRIEV